MKEDGFLFLWLNFKELLLSRLSLSEMHYEILSGQYVGESLQLIVFVSHRRKSGI